MVGLRVRGRAHHLDDDRPPTEARTTFLVERSGEEASLLRTADGTVPLPGPASGTIPDLCRRMLGVSTAPPPSHSTGALWLVAWFDRLVERLRRPRPIHAHRSVMGSARRTAPGGPLGTR